MGNWTINGAPAAALGVSEIRTDRKSQAVSECYLTVAAPFDGSPIFGNGAIVVVSKDGAQFFYGRVERDPARGSAKGEYHDIRLVCPWWYLENRIYRQQWKQLDSSKTDGTKKSVDTTFCILGMKDDGTWQKTGGVIRDVLQMCIDSGAPFQIGSVTAGIYAPGDQANDITCAEAIHRMLRWTPDAVAWVDHTPSPPTINIARRGALGTVTLPANAAGGVNVSEVECEPCYNLQKTGVKIYYVDGGAGPFPTSTDRAGNTEGFNVLELTVRLGAAEGKIISNNIVTEAIPADQIDDNFWKDAHPELWKSGNGIDKSSIVLSQGDLGNTYDYQLISGNITDWMKNNQNVNSAQDTAYVIATYKTDDGTQVVQQLTFSYVSCNQEAPAPAGRDFTWGEGQEPAEQSPNGLAANILSAISSLHYTGSLTLAEAEVGRSLLGNKLNLTGGQSAWTGMNALIIGVTENVSSGRTVIKFGPPPCLSSEDMIALARMNRIRAPASAAQSMKDGGGSSSTPSVGGGDGPANSPSSAFPSTIKQLVIKSSDGGSVTIKPADLATNPDLYLVAVQNYGTDTMSVQLVKVKVAGEILKYIDISNGTTIDCGAGAGGGGG